MVMVVTVGHFNNLEEICEASLSKIIVKMQCQARRVLVDVTYQGKISEKKAISSIQRNIHLYYNCRDWVWYQFYTMIKGEISLKKRLAEKERRKLMAEKLAKFQTVLAEAITAREAAAAANIDAVAKISALKSEMEGLCAYAGEQAELIQAAQVAADDALMAYAVRVAWVVGQNFTPTSPT